ncbi:hypothetical protein [Ligilactobacillus ruminis]|nr:hypothetical protein [Ligilactobacillus ruminis]
MTHILNNQQAKSQLLRENVKNVVYNPAEVPYDWKTVYIAKQAGNETWN